MIAERAASAVERSGTFDCFGSECTVLVAGPADDAAGAVARCRRYGRPTTPGGLVDPTLVREIEPTGYDRHFEGSGIALEQALGLAPRRAPGRARSGDAWRAVSVDRRTSTVTRPPGVRLDPRGIAKGVFADELAAGLRSFGAFVIDYAGDLRLGGALGVRRPVHVASPFDGSVLHTFALTAVGVATSGIGRRSWMREGRPAHHLLDPATGAPAFTGVVQVTALAPTATEAEALSKAALLSGPDGADSWLPYGGVVVLEDGSRRVLEPSAALDSSVA